MSRRLVVVSVFSALTLSACGEQRGADAPETADVPETADTTGAAESSAASEPLPEYDPERAAALGQGLQTLRELVLTLERIDSPFDAHEEAPEVLRLLQELDAAQAAFTFSMSEEQVRAVYPDLVRRHEALNRRRVAALQRIETDPRAAEVLARRIAELEAAQ